MKAIRVIALIALVISAFISLDLLVNVVALTVPQLQDGLGFNSVLQSAFGILEKNEMQSAQDFFYAFKNSAYGTFALFTANAILHIVEILKKNT